jgi:membrane protein required for colicin V production
LNLLDAIIIIVVAVGFILGYKDGIVRKIIGLIGFTLAVFLSIKYADWLGLSIENVLGIEYYLSEIIAGVAIFLVIILIFTILKRIIHPFDKVNNFINQILGGIVGAIQILFFLSGVLYIINIFNAPSKNAKDNSVLYQKVYDIIPGTINLISNYTPKPREMFKEYINEKDST